MAGAPPFDPNQPFEPVSAAAPAFDPNKPFEAVDSSPSQVGDFFHSLPRAVMKGLSTAGSALGQATQIEMGQPVDAPGPEETLKHIEKNVTGEMHKPETPAGHVAEHIGEALGNPASYIAPGGPLVGAGLATLSGLGSGVGEQLAGTPGEVAGGLLGPLAGGAAITKTANAARRAMIPATAEHFKDADNAYKAVRGFGVEVHAKEVEDLANRIVSNLHTEGYRDIAGAPGQPVFRAIEELRDPVGVHATVDDIEAVRKVLRRMGKNYEHRDAVRRATGEIDDFMANLTPAQVAINPQFAGRVSATMKRARASYAAGSRSEEIEDAVKKAEETAAAAGWGGNTTNRIKQEIRKLEDRGLTTAEQAARDRVVHGSRLSNLARTIGHWLSPNTLTTPAHLGAIWAGGPSFAGIAGAGMAGRIASGALTRGHLNDFHDMVRMRSPLGQNVTLPDKHRFSPYAIPALVGATNPYDSSQP